jgi:hypothetical protein
MSASVETTRPAPGTDSVLHVARPRIPTHIWILSLIMLAGLACRLFDLSRLPLWSDEAESSINALTILEKGVPADSYQGNPLYENWMVRIWPDNPEYEFRDISYSDRKMAVYHSWLPLYSIAFSFRLLGITAGPSGALRPQYGSAERRWRSIAARVPSVFFGTLCILGFYLAGVRLRDRQTGLLAAFLAAFLAIHISYSQTARYYAASAAAITFCFWATLAMRQSARWRDFLFGSFLFSLLFYTHLLAFAVAFLMWAIAMATRVREWRLIGSKVVVFLLGVAGLCTPWLIATDFLHYNSQIPRAWKRLNLPGDLIIGHLLFSEFGFVLLIGIILAGAAAIRRGRMSARFVAPLRRYEAALVFSYLWLILSYFVFFFNIPAPSFIVGRLSLVLLPATLLIVAMIFCSVAAIVSKRNAPFLATIGAVAFILISNWRHPHNLRLATLGLTEADDILPPTHLVDTAVEYLRTMPINGATRLFASPDMQFVLTFYTGMLVQSIVPVRKQYLDDYPGDIILFSSEAFWRTGPVSPDRLHKAAIAVGRELSAQDALDLSCRLSSLAFRSQQAAKVSRVVPPLAPVPPFAASLWAAQQKDSPEWFRGTYSWFPGQFLLFRDFEIRDSSEWWLDYFYALVGPEQRRAHPNYENRIRNATLTVLPCADLVAYYSPGNLRTPE